MTLTYDNRAKRESSHSSPVSIITWTLVTNASGDVSEETESVLYGRINRVVTIPDDGDTPSAFWDLTIADDNGIDLLNGDRRVMMLIQHGMRTD